MASNKRCIECQTTNLVKFRSLGSDKWKEIKAESLERETWKEGIVLCNICYMNCVENPLRRSSKRRNR